MSDSSNNNKIVENMKRFIFAIFTLANVISVNGDNIFGHRNETWINQTSINNLATVSKIHKNSSRGDRFLSHRSRYTQVPVPATRHPSD